MKKICIFLIFILLSLIFSACESEEEIPLEDNNKESKPVIDEDQTNRSSDDSEETVQTFDVSDYIKSDQYIDISIIEDGFGDFKGKLYLLGQEYDQLYFMKTRSDGNTTYLKFLVVDQFFEKVYSTGQGSLNGVIKEEAKPQFVLDNMVFGKNIVILYVEDTAICLNVDGDVIYREKIPMTPEDVSEDKDGRFAFMDISGQISDWRISNDQRYVAYVDDEGGKVYDVLRQDSHTIALHDEGGRLEIDRLFGDDQYIQLRTSFSDKSSLYYLHNFHSGLTTEEAYDKDEDLEKRAELVSFIQEVPYHEIVGIADETLLVLIGPSEDQASLIGVSSFPYLADKDLTPVSVSLKILTQTIEFQVAPKEELPMSHWSDRLEITFLGVQDDGLTSALTSFFGPNSVTLESDNTLVTISLEDLKTFNLDRRAFQKAGYILSEDVDLVFEPIDLDYNLIRWNKDMTETMLLSSGIVDDYIKVELVFNKPVNQEDMEATLNRNILYEEDYLQEDISGISKPSMTFEWKSDREVIIEVTQMESGVYYGITPNGYKDENGKTYFNWQKSHQSFGGLRDYTGGIYVLQKISSDSLSLVEYDVKKESEKEIASLQHYRFNVGCVVDQLVHLATSEEYGYYSFIYDMGKDRLYDEDMYISYRNDGFTSKDQVYICGPQSILRFDKDEEALIPVYEIPSQYVNIFTISKHPSKDLYVLLVAEETYGEFSLLTLDEDFKLIGENHMDYHRSGFYGMIQEIYWTGDRSIGICGGVNDIDTNTQMISKIYDIYTGEIIKDFPDQIIFSVSPKYDYIIMQDRNKEGAMYVYNQDYDFLYEKQVSYMDESAAWYGSVAIFQYTDIWYDDTLYLNLDGENIIRKWKVNNDEEAFIELPYERFVMIDVLGEDLFKLFLNVDPIHRSEPFWS